MTALRVHRWGVCLGRLSIVWTDLWEWRVVWPPRRHGLEVAWAGRVLVSWGFGQYDGRVR